MVRICRCIIKSYLATHKQNPIVFVNSVTNKGSMVGLFPKRFVASCRGGATNNIFAVFQKEGDSPTFLAAY